MRAEVRDDGRPAIGALPRHLGNQTQFERNARHAMSAASHQIEVHPGPLADTFAGIGLRVDLDRAQLNRDAVYAETREVLPRLIEPLGCVRHFDNAIQGPGPSVDRFTLSKQEIDVARRHLDSAQHAGRGPDQTKIGDRRSNKHRLERSPHVRSIQTHAE